MVLFKTLDLRGLPFSNGFQLAQQEFGHIKKNGILEIILDRKKNFTEAFKNWARTNGHNISDIDDNLMIRLFIKKCRQRVKLKHGFSGTK